MNPMDKAEARINAAYCREIERIRTAQTAAKAVRADVDHCREHTNAFVFYRADDPAAEGGNGPVVILKSTGQAVRLSACLCSLGDFIREWSC